MLDVVHPVETALRSGSRAKNLSRKISELCSELPSDVSKITPAQRGEIMQLAAACRATRPVVSVLAIEDVSAIENAADFFDLFNEVYYPVLEDGKRSVGFWSIKDMTTLMPDDVHEWVRDRQVNQKTGNYDLIAIPFGNWWRNHRPDYEIYGIASDRSAWKSKIIDAEGHKCVNSSYGKPPVLKDMPAKYGDGAAACEVLEAVLAGTITDPDPNNAKTKRSKFVLDVGAHLTALRDGGDFRCRKLFCFTSTNGGQGAGKSLLQESIAALVPRDASVTVPTTCLADTNLLPLYSASVCILTEAPSTVSERYTSEDVKAFADAGWKTAQEKYVAKRSVRDNSLKFLSSNHLSPLPIDSARSRRVEFFVAADNKDGGTELCRYLDRVQRENNWTAEDLRTCVGWALLTTAESILAAGGKPSPVARRSIAAAHLLAASDYDYLVVKKGNEKASYTDYRDFRTDHGLTWSPDLYKFETAVELSRSVDAWIDDVVLPIPPGTPPVPPTEPVDEEDKNAEPAKEEPKMSDPQKPAVTGTPKGERIRLQFKSRMATAFLAPKTMSIAEIFVYITSDVDLEQATKGVREGTADKKLVLRQIFPGAQFDRFSRGENIVKFTGLTHVDFDNIAENGNGLTPEEVRDELAEMPGFVIGGLSSRGNGAWGIFYAGPGIVDYQTYMAAERALFAATEERLCIVCDKGMRLPTVGRTIAHDKECRADDGALAGIMPEPYPWKAPTYGVVENASRLMPTKQTSETTVDERIRNEKFLEAVVSKACEKIQNAGEGERHDTSIRAVANIVTCCNERAVTPLASWGRRLHDACVSCGLPSSETNSIMTYWTQRTGMSC